ncbi:hypothetical protein GGR57DRAFT_475382 [Xylariaceae sp. FL1272]|nr:hypothetical protein GGR57DRAFT_475382 [Xylariaceae sp. FL1272]
MYRDNCLCCSSCSNVSIFGILHAPWFGMKESAKSCLGAASIPDSREWFPPVFNCIVLYVSICMAIHLWRKVRKTGRPFDATRMTLEEAYVVKDQIASQDFRRVFPFATSYALVKSYEIPSIAGPNARAAQRTMKSKPATTENTPSNTGNTFENLMGPLGSPESLAAIDKINRIHSLYRPTGKMSDDDLLFVLSLLVLEPIRWIERYEYRCLTPKERCALATFWNSIGKKLYIPYDTLPSHNEFIDALQWLDELEQWSLSYEEKKTSAVRSQDAAFLADHKIDSWLQGVPAFLKPTARDMLAVLIEPRIRTALGIDEPSPFPKVAVHTIIPIRKMLQHCFVFLVPFWT